MVYHIRWQTLYAPDRLNTANKHHTDLDYNTHVLHQGLQNVPLLWY